METTSREKTQRGFVRVEFTDRYGESCSLQESSLATEAAVWLGQNKPTFDDKKELVGCRMHLTQDMAKWLIEELQYFVDTGAVRF
jgi:hypothetical protein